MTTRYCSQCGTRLVLAMAEGRPHEQCPACDLIVYHNPKPIGLAVIQHQEKLVLIRRSAAPLANYWAPPAGYVENGESVPEAVIREAREECGLDIALDNLINVYSQADVDVLIVAYRAHSIGGRLMAGDDASEAKLFAADALPVQTEPVDGTVTDHWFYSVVKDTIVPWSPS